MLALVPTLDFSLATLFTFAVKFIVDRKSSLILDPKLASSCRLIIVFVEVINIYKYCLEPRPKRIRLYFSVHLRLKSIRLPVYKDERLCVFLRVVY